MSLRIIKAGLLDSIQDTGRYGFQHLGVNPGGAMDRFSAKLANALLGKDLNSAVLELHYPSAQIYFDQAAMIAVSGADFSPFINGHPVPMHHSIVVPKNSILKFEGMRSGARCYVSVWQQMHIPEWMESYSTNLQARTGGWEGRPLQKDDVITFDGELSLNALLDKKELTVLPWTAHDVVETRNEIECILGSEWHWFSKETQEAFLNNWFQVTNCADRMGYQLAGPRMENNSKEQLVSSAVTFGTVQLLPAGQLIILMADHQTTGGYPRIAHVISAHLPLVAQKMPNDYIHFQMTDLVSAEEKIVRQEKYLNDIQIACKFNIQNLLNGSI